MNWRSPDIEFVSCDVFDTVLTRNAFHPNDVHARVEQRLFLRGLPDLSGGRGGYRSLRRAAEKVARDQLQGREDVRFADIVEHLGRMSSHSDAGSEVSALELAEEVNSVVPVAATLELLTSLRRQGKRIVFLSDMYLPEEVIRTMLARVGALEPGDGVYVSGDVGKKKATGSLFRFAQEQLRIGPRQMVHLGDYLVSDFVVPRIKCGIRSLPIRVARANVYETLWGDGSNGCLYCNSFSGASRAARVAMRPAAGPNPALYRIGCNVLGPLIGHFMLWTLRQAERAGIRRLYFLSRDGEVLLEAARRIAEGAGIDLELRYLMVSRTAVFPATAGEVAARPSLDWVKEDNIRLTLRIVADRLKMEPQFLLGRLQTAGLGVREVDAPLEQGTVERLVEALHRDAPLAQRVQEVGAEARRMLGGYLQQEGLFDGTPSAVVDLGWHGTIQEVLYACFGDRLGVYGLMGYYFGLDRSGAPGCAKRGYLFEPGGADVGNRHHLFRVLLEVLCSGSHGMVHHYEKTASGEFRAVTLPVEDRENLLAVAEMRRGVAAFFDNLDSDFPTDADDGHVREKVLQVLLKLFLYPDRDEAEALGQLRFSADQAGHGVRPLAPPFDAASALSYFGKRSYAGRSTISSWFFASWVRASMLTRTVLYPFVVLLRGHYAGTLTLKLAKLRAIDALNRVISIT